MADTITKRIALEIIEHEAVVRELYLDSVDVPTWSVGITHFSGHQVDPRYRDNPQSLERCFEVFEWALRVNFLPAVLREFQGHELTEEQLGAALSFHWNTGGINQAIWCDQWKDGRVDDARASFMNWSKPPEIIPRREKERDLFFDGIWTSDGVVTEYPVLKPSYKPDFRHPKQVDVDHILDDLFGEEELPPKVVEIDLSREAAQELYDQLKPQLEH